MRLRRLRIDRLPGIEPGFSFEPSSDGLNIVTGPNAIGKSSLARALGFLLHQRKDDPAGLQLEAEFDSGDTRWVVRRLGSAVDWRRNGEATTAPNLPGTSQFGQYLLSVERLLGATESDKALARTLWRTLRGGYDLEAARRGIGSRHGNNEARQLREAKSALNAVERGRNELRRDEALLPELADRIQASTRARARCETLQRALDLHKATNKLRNCKAALDAFPKDMDKLRGNELERVSATQEKRKEVDSRRRDAQRDLDAANERLANSGFEARRTKAEDVANAEAALRRVERQADKRGPKAEQLRDAEARLQDAVKAFGGGGEPPRLDAVSLERAREIAEPLAQSQARERELSQRLESVGEPVDDSEIDRYREGALALREWLAATEAAESGRPSGNSLAISLAAGVLVLLALLAVAAFRTDIILLAGVVAVSAALCLTALWLSGGWRRELGRSVAAARRRFDATGLEAPSAWDRATVGAYFRDNIEPGLDRRRLQQERASGAEQLRSESKKVREQIEKLQVERHDFATEYGLDPELTGAPLLRFVTAVKDWDRARADRAKQLAAVEKLDEQIAEAAAQVRDFVREWREADAPPLEGSISDAGLQALRTAWDALQARLREAESALAAIQDARKDLSHNSERGDELDTEIAQIFREAGITQLFEASEADPGKRRKLEARELDVRSGQIDAWRAADKARTEAEIEVKRLRQLLDGEPSPVDSVGQADPVPLLVDILDEGAVESVERELQQATETAHEHDDLIRETQHIDTRLDEARAGEQLEQAAADHGKAVEALQDKRDEAFLAAATDFLLNDIEGAFRSEHEPKLLRRARERFEQATGREFTVELLDGEHFVATDTKQGEKRELAELSSGTRMQLLLALRLASTEETESGGETLPLFLDEALTTSDESRFAEIARTLSRLADEQRRQIFYFTARRQDTALWQDAIGEVPAVIDLAEVRFGARGDFALPPLPPAPRVPSPEGMDDEAYASAIGVPRVDPRRDPGGIHLFHTLRDDLKLLHTLLDAWRISALGQLESLLASSAAEGAVPDAAACRRLRDRCRVAREWAAAWREGRGKPVDRIALEQADGVTDVFLDRVAALAERVAGDGPALVAQLKVGTVKRFRSRNVDQLEDWLVEHGYIDRAEIRNRDGRRLQTLQRAATAHRSDPDPADLNRAIDWLEAAAVEE